MPESAAEKAAKAAAKKADEAAADSKADKQLDLLYKGIRALKETTYHKFRKQIRIQSKAFQWHASLLDPSIPRPQETQKSRLDERNAFLLLVNKVEDHPVESVLASCPDGDAQQAYRLCHEFFHRKTQAGKNQATTKFYSATMENTDTNITEWAALVTERAEDLISSGTPASEAAQLSVLLTGLLPDFNPIRMIIQNNAAMTLIEARATLHDWATEWNHLLTTKHGTKHASDNTFSIETDPKKQAPCRSWSKNACRYGDKCHFKHEGPGGFWKDRPKQPKKTPPVDTATPSSSCQLCLQADHVASTCPRLSRNPQAFTGSAPPAEWPPPREETFHMFSADAEDVPAPVMSQPHLPMVITEEDDDETRQNVSVTHYLLMAMTIVLACWTACHLKLKNLNITFLIYCTFFLAVSLQAFAVPSPHSVCPHANSMVKASSFFNDISTEDSKNRCYEWCSDSGTNRFVTNDERDFVPGSIIKSNTNVAVGGGSVTSPSSGTVMIDSISPQTGQTVTIQCSDVLLIKECSKKLIPASQFVRKGCTLTYTDINKVYLYDKKKICFLQGEDRGGLYYFKCKTRRGKNATAAPHVLKSTALFGLPAGGSRQISSSSNNFARRLLEAHWSYGHLHFDKLRTLLGLKKGDDPECPACTIAKSRQTALAKYVHTRSTRVNHRMHMDLGFTVNCNYCFQLYIDDYTRESHLDVLTNKGETLSSWQKLRNHLLNRNAPWKFAFVKTDGESVYDNQHWDKDCAANGIFHEFNGRYRHDQHGVAERGMQSIGIPFRCMMIQGCAPESDIPDCLRQANVIRNHSPTKANNGWTPREKAAGMKLPVNKRLLRGPLFCLVYAHVYEEERVKHAPRGIASVYLGYDDANNTYLVKEWVSGKRYYTTDVTFHPNSFPYRANPSRLPRLLHQFNDMAPHNDEPILIPPNAPRQSSRPPQPSDQFLRNLPDQSVPPSAAAAANFSIHNFGPDPDNLAEAMKSHDANEWMKAILMEKASWDYHGVREPVERQEASSSGKRVFKPRPVFKRKINPPDDTNPEATIEKYKYRLTIAAYTKMLIQGIDYKEKHASTVRWNSIKILIAIAVKFDLDIILFDISTFFLYGQLDEPVYMEIPEGWDDDIDPSIKDPIWKLKKAAYGLPQAGFCAQRELKSALTTTSGNKFRPTASDDCVYINNPKHCPGYAATGAFVDDLLGVGDKPGLQELEKAITDKFKITVKRDPKIILGVQLERNRAAKWAKLHQTFFTTELLRKYNMLDARPTDTPMDPGTAKALMLLSTDGSTKKSVADYQRLVGNLMWLMKTRTDMFFTINLLSRFLTNATTQHLELAKGRPLRYLAGTITHGIVYNPGDGEWVLSGASDSDLAGDLKTARSTSGYLTKLGEFGNIMCSSSLERKVSTSTGQAETYALQSLCKEVIWCRRLLHELRYPQSAPTIVRNDNDGVVNQSTKAINHAIAKHYRIAQAFIRQLVNDRIVGVDPVDTHENESDMLTKALHAPLFIKHNNAIMGPQNRPT